MVVWVVDKVHEVALSMVGGNSTVDSASMIGEGGERTKRCEIELVLEGFRRHVQENFLEVRKV